MIVNLKIIYFFLKHSTFILIFNIIVMFIFMFLYLLCNHNDPKSFYNPNPYSKSHKSVDTVDHFLLSVSIQSSVGYVHLIPVTNAAKILISLQEFIVMCCSLISVYMFIYFFMNK